jgi:hypothetical protein
VLLQKEMNNIEIIDMAKENCNLNFLKTIWENTFSTGNGTMHGSMVNKTMAERKNSKFLKFLEPKKRGTINNEILFNNGQPIFWPKDLIKYYKDLKNINAMKHVIKWNYLDQDTMLLSVLFDTASYDKIAALIFTGQINRWEITKDQFRMVIEQSRLDLIVYFLNLRSCRMILEDFQIQQTVVSSYMKVGYKMYYGAEMLTYIYKINWNNELTKELCKNIMRTIKTKDILNCHSPILTCLLLSEFLTQIGEISVLYRSQCEKAKLELLQFCYNIQESNPDESYIKFLMTQKDTRGRTALIIASENSFYHVLETPQMGTIVNKMWNGKMSNNGFFAPCSMHRYIASEMKTTDPFFAFDKLDNTKVYFYQLGVWEKSCSLRYLPESISTVGLILIYNIFIYMLVDRGQMMNGINELDADLFYLNWTYVIWVLCINFNTLNVIYFQIKTGRKVRLDVWVFVEVIMLVFAILLLVDIKKVLGYFGDDVLDSAVGTLNDLSIPFAKALNIQADFSGSSAYLIQAFLYAVNAILVWLRITGILLTFKNIGPLIRMIYLMSILLFKNLVVYALYLTCCAAIFTAIFNSNSLQFYDFSTTVISLFGSFINTFDAFGFDDADPTSEHSYFWFGALMIIAYNSVSAVLMINLLIAILSDVYETLALLVDASHRSVLINYYRKYKWDDKYGHLIFLTTPISVINYILLPFSYCYKKQEDFNKCCSMIFYGLFYFPFIFIVYMIYTIVLIPFCYLKGISYSIKHQMTLKYNKIWKTVNVFKWLFFGFFFLVFIYFRDLYFILKTVFTPINRKSNETNRFKKFITKEEVIVFLKFIHSQNNEPQDLHSLFMNYLTFETREKAEKDEKLREKSRYIEKLNLAANKTLGLKNPSTGRRRSIAPTSTTFIYNTKSNNMENTTISSNYIKKNLIIIEILENFLIEPGTNSLLLDIEKLKMLLPKTMNIDNDYIKRLVHTDISSLNKAVNKLKMKKYVFNQYQLINKILNTAIRIDKDIDFEILKKYRHHLRARGSANDPRYVMEEFNEIEVAKDLKKLVDGLNDEVKEVVEFKKKAMMESRDRNERSRHGTAKSKK